MNAAIASVVFLGCLAGCAPRLEGAYVDVTGAPAFQLTNGKYVEPRVKPLPRPYKVDGEVIIVGVGEQATTFAILPGGALQLNQNGQVFTHAAK